MNTEINEVEINGVKYVRKDSIQNQPELSKSGYAIIRCIAAGVFLGFVAESNIAAQTVTLKNARRLWYWSGAASLSQLAMDGTSNPKDCKFPCEVSQISLAQVIEIIPVTEKALESLKGVSIWKA